MLNYLALFAVALAAGCSTARYHPPPNPYLSVSGSFNQPGIYLWTNGLTLFDAIRLGGGFSSTSVYAVYVYHRDGTRERYHLTPDFQCTNNVPLRARDDVFRGWSP
jgi:protein involved in polysaccharide export with SLBB domain